MGFREEEMFDFFKKQDKITEVELHAIVEIRWKEPIWRMVKESALLIL